MDDLQRTPWKKAAKKVRNDRSETYAGATGYRRTKLKESLSVCIRHLGISSESS